MIPPEVADAARATAAWIALGAAGAAMITLGVTVGRALGRRR